MSPRRNTVLILSLAFAGLAAWMFSAGGSQEVLPLGSALPPLTVRCQDGDTILTSDSCRSIVIALVRVECSHCRYELDVLDTIAAEHSHTRLVLLSPDTVWSREMVGMTWSNLGMVDNVLVGTARRLDWHAAFGRHPFPTLLFFDRFGVLREKLFGEVKRQRISTILQNL
jgi:hypothetical protein